jgi:hypothetical protein
MVDVSEVFVKLLVCHYHYHACEYRDHHHHVYHLWVVPSTLIVLSAVQPWLSEAVEYSMTGMVDVPEGFA